jgi:hypothetical protein
MCIPKAKAISLSQINPSSVPEADLQGGPESPTQPGTYWYQRDAMSSAIMVELRVTNGELMVWWLTRPDEPVAKLKGWWRGPITPSTGTGSW